MARLSFRDRLFTPKVANAMMSPGGILLAGAGAAVAIVAGAPLALAAGVGVLAWGGRVLVAMPSNPTRPAPSALSRRRRRSRGGRHDQSGGGPAGVGRAFDDAGPAQPRPAALARRPLRRATRSNRGGQRWLGRFRRARRRR